MRHLNQTSRASLLVEMLFSTLPLIFIFALTAQFILQSQSRIKQASKLQQELQDAHLKQNSSPQNFKYELSSRPDHNSLSANWLKSTNSRKGFEFYNDTKLEWDFESGGMLDYETWLTQMRNFFSF